MIGDANVAAVHSNFVQRSQTLGTPLIAAYKTNHGCRTPEHLSHRGII